MISDTDLFLLIDMGLLHLTISLKYARDRLVEDVHPAITPLPIVGMGCASVPDALIHLGAR